MGHVLQCLKRPLDATDYNYIIGCTPFLAAAFAGQLFDHPMPSQQILSGVFLFLAYFPLWTRARKSCASTKLPLIGLAAAILLLFSGGVAWLLRRNILTKSPVLPLPGWALLTALVFGTGNALKFHHMLVAAAPQAPQLALLGQSSKVAASALLITGNSMLLGYHTMVPRRRAGVVRGLPLVAIAALLRLRYLAAQTGA